ncbi:retrovirus-related pol polyprotein from transposon TNT 1-94 [Tanacetum coccineum]
MKDIFEELEAKVDQNVVHRKHAEIERKNLLIANDNLIDDCLSKDVFCITMNSKLTVSRFTEMHDAHTIVQARCLELESELSKLRDKIQIDDHNELVNHFSNLEVNHLNLQLKYQNLKESFGNNPPPPARETSDFDSVFVIGKMKAFLQGKENVIKKLKMQISQLKETRSEADRTLDFRALDFQITQLTEKVTTLQEQNELFRAENGKIKQHYKELYDSIKITCAKHIEQTTALLTENENLKVQIHNKMQSVTTNPIKTRVLAPGKYAIDVEPIPPRNRNNREVHLDYLKHLKESVKTIREIVEEAKVERPLDRSLAFACLYTKHSQELLEYVIGTCLKDFNQRDKKHAYTPLTKKKQVTFKPRSNTKKNRILPAKSVNKKNVEEHPRTNKSNLKTKNRVDSSISSKRTVIQIVLWYLDSGSSKHMTGDRSRLGNFVKKFIGIVRFGNDHFGTIMVYRDYVIGDSVIYRVEVVATVCYTQNRSLIHTLHNKTPYELVHDKKPDLTFFRVFGALCYPTNDSEDLGKLQPTADIGIFVGYAPSRKGTGPAPSFLTPGQISSGLVPNPVPVAPYVTPTNKELEILFQPMFDEYLEPPRVKRPVYPALAVPVHVTSAGTPSFTTIDQDAPSPSRSPSSSVLQSPCSHQGVAAGSTIIEDNPFAPVDNNPFINVFAPKPSFETSSSEDVSSTESTHLTQPHHHLGKWSKDHPLDNVIGNPSRSISTRKQLATDALRCLYNSVLSKVKPKNFKSVVIKDYWFQAMQDEIYEFDRL